MPGKSVCTVIGSSGAGKTTLAKLLVGVNKPTKGYVRLDGVAVYSWSSRDLGKNIGYLPQTIDLFEGTIAQNISRFEKIDSNKLKECIQLSGIQELISKLNNGLDTIISEVLKLLSDEDLSGIYSGKSEIILFKLCV